MTILCAIDHSPAAAGAAQLGARLTSLFGDELVLFHCVEPPPLPLEVPVGAVWREELTRAARRELEALIRAVGATVPTAIEVSTGVAADTIVSEARRRSARLIVMGTHGRRGAAHLILGSVAEQVASTAPCPVLIAHTAPASLARWDHTRPLNVLVGVDASAASDSAIEWVRPLRRQLVPVDVTVVHSYDPVRESLRLGLAEDRLRTLQPWDIERVLEADLAARVGNLPGLGRLVLRVLSQTRFNRDPVAVAADVLAPDLVVAGMHPRPFHFPHGAAALAILRDTVVPVVCVNAATGAEARREDRAATAAQPAR